MTQHNVWNWFDNLSQIDSLYQSIVIQLALNLLQKQLLSHEAVYVLNVSVSINFIKFHKRGKESRNSQDLKL